MCSTAPSSAATSSSAPARSVSTSLGLEIGGAREAAIEMRRRDLHPPEREIAEAGIELRLRMAREEAPAHARVVGAVALDLREGAEHGQARMGQRIALAGLGEQHRGAAVDLDVGGMGRKPRDQDQRRAVDVGRDVDQRGERVAGIAVERRRACRRGSPAAGSWRSAFGIEIGWRRRAFRQAVGHRRRAKASAVACSVSRHADAVHRPPNPFICLNFSPPLSHIRAGSHGLA